MLYLEDYLELIEHLPQELRDRLTYVRESDLRVNNSSLQLDSRVSQFFAEAKELTPEQRQREYEEILNEYKKTSKYADDKVNITTQTHDIMIKLVDRLNGELEKFKLELEADHAGITEELERRSLELDSDVCLDGIINNHLYQSNNVVQTTSNPLAHFKTEHQNYPHNNNNICLKFNSSGIKDRRKSEHKQHHRNHPYHQDNGYHKKGKLSQNEFISVGGGSSANQRLPQYHYKQHPSVQSRQSSTASSPTPFGANLSSSSAPPSVAGDPNGIDMNGGHYSNNLTSFGNNSSFMKNSYKNLPINQHSALSAALSSATTPTPQQLNSVSAFAMMNASNSTQGNKISMSHTTGLKDNSDLSNPLMRQNPIAAAASQAIAATQQLQQGRRTSSLKASFAAINAAGIGGQIDAPLGPGDSRNALAPVPPDQQAAYRYNNYGKLNANGNPLYMSITKSGRPSKRPKHPTSHLYPDESPTSISSDNSVFENSESISSAEYMETGTTFDSTSPTSFDFNNSTSVDQSGADPAIYQRDDTKYCICRQISYGEMVACDNEECEIEWFHYNCVGVTQPPKGKWFCPDCIRKMDPHLTQPTQKKRSRKEVAVNEK